MEIVAIQKEEYQRYQEYFRLLFNKLVFLETIQQDRSVEFYKVLDEKQKVKFIFYVLMTHPSNSDLCLPISAPYWSLESVRKEERPEIYHLVIKEVISFLKKRFTSIQITLPPVVYDSRYMNLLIKSFIDCGAVTRLLDYNHHFNIRDFNAIEYINKLPSNSRRNLKIAQESNLTFLKLRSKQFKEAYEVIRENRIHKNYPLKVSMDQMLYNLKAFKGDVFAVIHDSTMIASALVFKINDSAYQLIYWGDLPGVSDLKPMNFLAFEMLNYYQKKQLNLLDLGPSSDTGQINEGLSAFKESLGAETSLKYTLTIN